MGLRFCAKWSASALLLAACAPAPAAVRAPATARAPGHAVAPRPEHVSVPRTIVTPTEATSIPEMYERAEAQLRAGDAARAERAFDRIVALDPQGRLAPDALFGAGEAADDAADLEGASQRYEQVAERFPDNRLARPALVRNIRLLLYLEKWKRAGEVADVLMARYHDLRPFESIVAFSGKALALVAVQDLDDAEFYIGKGRDVVEAHHYDEAGRIPRDIAQLYYALGEVRRIRAERIHFVPVPPNFAAVLEQRCQLLLDAQSAYSDAMRAYDAHWSAMAGYRVGELYEKLHEDLMQVPPPKTARTPEQKELFEGAMRLRYSVLLRKALTMMEHTISMTSRTGERSEWVDKAHDAEVKIRRAIQAEDQAIDRLPYSRAELQAALDHLAKRAARQKH
jgi:tetratricopeptide (TPR) repeat protein